MRNTTMTRYERIERFISHQSRGLMRNTVVLFILGLLVLTGCDGIFHQAPSEKVKHYQANYEIIGSEKDKMLDHVSKTIYETSDRSNSKAKEVEITVVSEKGEDISVTPGRYEIVGDVTGNVYIRDENGDLLFRDILEQSYGVGSITVDLNDTHTIHVDGFEEVYVRPVPTELSTELTAGIWEVGIDIEAGDYTITSPYGAGYLQIFDSNAAPKVYEVIGGNFSSTKSDVQLTNGQKLRITGISMIQFKHNGK